MNKSIENITGRNCGNKSHYKNSDNYINSIIFGSVPFGTPPKATCLFEKGMM